MYKNDTDNRKVSIFISVTPMEFQIHFICTCMAAYRDVVVGAVTWLRAERPSSLRFDCRQGHLD
jgi:hypothetical protein